MGKQSRSPLDFELLHIFADACQLLADAVTGGCYYPSKVVSDDSSSWKSSQ